MAFTIVVLCVSFVSVVVSCCFICLGLLGDVELPREVQDALAVLEVGLELLLAICLAVV